jgi:hypothetical protein
MFFADNERDSPTFDLTVRPLSGAITASPLLNSNGGAKVKTSGNLGDITLFNCHFMTLNKPILQKKSKFSSTTVTGYIFMPVSASAVEALTSREFHSIRHFAVFCFIIRVSPLF